MDSMDRPQLSKRERDHNRDIKQNLELKGIRKALEKIVKIMENK